MTDEPRSDPGLSPTHDPEESTTRSLATSGEEAGSIESYRLLQKLGEGGMGEVWLAEQADPIRRQVALKIIKAGMDTKRVIARFEAERQALALMDHPCIAKVFEAGATQRGLPYFAMEYVKGEPFTTYCDRQRLRTLERLVLLMQVCHGVQHAHQKGIIHRDLKPSNVLVSLQDDKPVPKIIDFGVAKATGSRLTDKSMHTELGVLVGTPEYMSPEQADLTGLDIDTRTDVYALGVMLYEVLCGALPFESSELRSRGLDDLRRRIREVEPPRPSTRVKTLGERAEDIARRRQTDSRTLVLRLKGDLDWIVMKALEKDRTRRYGSPSELAADIERHLRHEPVVAGPRSASYRTRKFVRRHRLGAGVAVAAVFVLMTFAGTMAWQARRIALERDRANREARTLGQTVNFLTGLFKVSDPSQARGSPPSAREILDRGAKRLATELAGEPETQASLMTTIAIVYENLGLYEPATPLLEQSLSLRRTVLGNDHPDTLSSISNLGNLLGLQGKLKEAEPFVQDALKGRRRVLGNDHLDTLASMSNMGNLLSEEGKLEAAEPYFRDALQGYRRVFGDDHPDTISSINNLAIQLAYEGKVREAEPLYREALERRRRVLGNDHPDTLASMSNLAVLLANAGKVRDAERLFREALAGRRRVLGDEHPDTLDSISNIGILLDQDGRPEEAEPYLREALEKRRQRLGEDHPSTLDSIQSMAVLLSHEGKLGEAESYLRNGLERSRRVNGEDHFKSLNFMAALGSVCMDEGRLDEAETLLNDAMTRARALPSSTSVVGAVLNSYGRYLTLTKRYVDAEAALLEAQGILANTDAEENQKARQNLAALYQVWGKPDKAAMWRAKASAQ